MKVRELELCYGNWSGYGWGVVTFDVTDGKLIAIDFDPEFEYKIDVSDFWRRRKKILTLEKMTYIKYANLLFKGYRKFGPKLLRP